MKLVITLGIIGVISSFALGFEEDFETYINGQAIVPQNSWTANGPGNYFEANETVDGTNPDPDFLGTHYADISNNGTTPTPSEIGDASITHTFSTVSAGTCVTEFDVRFSDLDPLFSCDIFICDSSSRTLQAAGISMVAQGLRVLDGDWTGVDYVVNPDTWYHAWITVDLDQDEWQLQMAEYTGEILGSPTTVSYNDWSSSTTVDTFSFRSPVSDVGIIEFGVSQAVMEDSQGRGMYVDNINVPEPTTLSMLAVAGAFVLRRRK
jgi:hypothetical protein